jgi:DNA-binding transcriptional regulator YiaG
MNIRKIRESAYMTQAEFSKAIGVSCVAVVKWESGKANPSLRHQKRILDFAKENNITVE